MIRVLNRASNVAAALATLSLCGCLQQLTEINNSLSKASQIFSPGSQHGSPAGDKVLLMPHMTKPQLQTLHNQFSIRPHDPAVVRAREEARPVLEKILTISACHPDMYIHQYLVPYWSGQNHTPSAPMAGMQYHPKSECLTVTRLDNWRMNARNAFSFRAIYISDASSESRAEYYEMVKQPDGAWLLR